MSEELRPYGTDSTDPPAEPLTREEQYLSAIAGVTSSSDIPPKPLTRAEKYLNKIVENGGGGGGGGTTNYNDLSNRPQVEDKTLEGNMSLSDLGAQAALDTNQMAAVNSGVTSTDVEQIGTNKNNISTLQTSLAVGSSDNAKVLTAIYEGGEGSYAWITPSGGGGTTDYQLLDNKPQINSVTLTGNKSLSDLGIAAASDIPTVPITEIQKNSTTISPVSGVVNITVPTSAADVSALPASTKYAGASTAGGSATSAAKLDTTSAGSTTQPVYFANGVPTATTYSLAKSVPSDAVFTDTTYSSKSASSGGTAVSLCTTGEKYTWNNKQSALSTSQLNAVNSGIDSTKVAQIETNKTNILNKQNKTWTQLKNVTTASETFELDLTDKSEVKILLIYQSNMYEASAPVNLINANYKLIVSQVDSATPNTAIGTLIKNTNDFTATIPSNSYSLRIFAR